MYNILFKCPFTAMVCGATGSGKSVCINTILMSLLFTYSPDNLKLMLIDPKMVELAAYNELPHLITPVITDAKIATAGLKWAVGGSGGGAQGSSGFGSGITGQGNSGGASGVSSGGGGGGTVGETISTTTEA